VSSIDSLKASAVDPSLLRPDPQNPNYTIPRAWGVYEIIDTNSLATGKRFRKGNHPIRHKELLLEFGPVNLVALFTQESMAVDLALLLNTQ